MERVMLNPIPMDAEAAQNHIHVVNLVLVLTALVQPARIVHVLTGHVHGTVLVRALTVLVAVLPPSLQNASRLHRQSVAALVLDLVIRELAASHASLLADEIETESQRASLHRSPATENLAGLAVEMTHREVVEMVLVEVQNDHLLRKRKAIPEVAHHQPRRRGVVMAIRVVIVTANENRMV